MQSWEYCAQILSVKHREYCAQILSVKHREYCAQILSVKHGGEVKHHAGGRHLLLGVDAVLDPIVDLLICGAADLSPVALGTGLLPFATEDAGRISQWEAPRLPEVTEEMLACSRYVETRRRRREASLPMASKRRRGRR
jgi:hypothetical protein